MKRQIAAEDDSPAAREPADATGFVVGPNGSGLSPELVAAYLSTDFVVFGPPEVVFKVGRPSLELHRLMEAHGVDVCAFLTAFNPFSEPTSAETNATAQVRLLEKLRQMRMTWLEGEGRDPSGEWPPEPSILVLGLDAGRAGAVGRDFRQNAVVTCRRGHAPELLLLR